MKKKNILASSKPSGSAVNKFWSRCPYLESRPQLPRGVWGHAPRKFWNLDAWKCYFQRFPYRIWASRTVKIETTLTIFYVYYNRSFPQNLNHWLWPGRHISTCERLGSSVVKICQAFHDPSITSICFNFLYFHRRVKTFKLLKCAFT